MERGVCVHINDESLYTLKWSADGRGPKGFRKHLASLAACVLNIIIVTVNRMGRACTEVVAHVEGLELAELLN